MNILSSIVVGVVSGVLASALIFLAVQLFQRAIIPWYRQLVYRGIDVTGTWENRLEFGKDRIQTATIVLTQRAERVNGTVTLMKVIDNRTRPAETLELDAELSNRFLVGTMSPTDSKRLVAVTVLLEVVGDGRRMKGWTSWYDAKAAQVTSSSAEWVRVELSGLEGARDAGGKRAPSE